MTAGCALLVFFVLAVCFYVVATVAPSFTVDAALAGGAVVALIVALTAYAMTPKES